MRSALAKRPFKRPWDISFCLLLLLLFLSFSILCRVRLSAWPGRFNYKLWDTGSFRLWRRRRARNYLCRQNYKYIQALPRYPLRFANVRDLCFHVLWRSVPLSAGPLSPRRSRSIVDKIKSYANHDVIKNQIILFRPFTYSVSTSCRVDVVRNVREKSCRSHSKGGFFLFHFETWEHIAILF